MINSVVITTNERVHSSIGGINTKESILNSVKELLKGDEEVISVTINGYDIEPQDITEYIKNNL